MITNTFKILNVQSNVQSSFENLPDDVKTNVGSFLNARDIGRLRRTSKINWYFFEKQHLYPIHKETIQKFLNLLIHNHIHHENNWRKLNEKTKLSEENLSREEEYQEIFWMKPIKYRYGKGYKCFFNDEQKVINLKFTRYQLQHEFIMYVDNHIFEKSLSINFTHITLMHLASIANNVDVVRILISYDANVNAKTKPLGATPLHLASDQGNLEVVKVLLYHNADVNAKTDEGWTPLQLALANASDPISIATFLISKGAHVDTGSIQNPNDSRNENSLQSPLHIAVLKAVDWVREGGIKGSEVIELIKAMIPKVSNLNQRDSNGKTPLFYAYFNIGMHIDYNIDNIPMTLFNKDTLYAISSLLIDNGAYIDEDDIKVTDQNVNLVSYPISVVLKSNRQNRIPRAYIDNIDIIAYLYEIYGVTDSMRVDGFEKDEILEINSLYKKYGCSLLHDGKRGLKTIHFWKTIH